MGGFASKPRESRQSKGTALGLALVAAHEPRPRELLEGAGAMREGKRPVGGKPVLLLRVHLAEGAAMAVRNKDRIIAEPGRSARREDEGPIHPTLESLDRPARPGQRQHADEGRPPRRPRGAGPEFPVDAGDRHAEVLCRARPPRRVNARRAVERVDAKSGIVAKRDDSRAARGGFSLEHGIIAEGRAGLLGLGKAEGAGADRLDAEGPQQFVDLTQLARIVGGDNETSGQAPALARAAQRTTIL